MTKNQSVKYRNTLANAPVQETANLAMGVLNRIQQTHSVGAQLGAVCVVFLTVLEKTGLNLHDALGMARNLINEQQGKRPEFEVVDMYVKNELFR